MLYNIIRRIWHCGGLLPCAGNYVYDGDETLA